MSFTAPLVLLGLIALPALAAWYVREQRRRTRAAGAFVTAALTASVAPRRPGVRRHVPVAILGLAVAALIIAAARPRVRVTETVSGATVMLINDISDSMTSTDVKPTRLAAAQKAAITFTDKAPDTVAIGSIDFARAPTLLAPPSTDHALARAAISKLKPGGGGTAIGEAIETGLTAIASAPKVDAKRPPGAIVLLSDGTSNVGVSPITAARTAKQRHVEIDTIAIGTAAGTMRSTEHGRTVTTPVPVNPSELRTIATTSGGSFAPAPNRATAQAIYAHLAAKLGHKRAWCGLIAEFAAAGLVLVLLAGGLSLRWFGSLT